MVGEQILSSVEFLSEVLPLVRHEHERWDGGGYPDGLAGEAIPLGSRIVLACDAYDAMTSDRPYRAAMTDAQARAELLAGAGTQFDERVVAALLQVLDEGTASARREARQVVLPARARSRPPGGRARAPSRSAPTRGCGSAPAASAASAGRPRAARKSNTVPPSTSASRAAGGNEGRPPSRSRRATAARMCGTWPDR